MSQNKVKITWKAIVAIALVMATLIAMSAAVSAGFVEFIFGEEYEVAATSSGSGGSDCSGGHDWGSSTTGSAWCGSHNKMCPVTVKTCARCNGSERTFNCETENSQKQAD